MVPKVTLYVPDDLWARAKGGNAEVNYSAVFQRALEAELRRREGKGMDTSTLDASVDLEGILARLRAERKSEYQDGYQLGLRFAEVLNFTNFDDMARSGWDGVCVQNIVRRARTTLERQHGLMVPGPSGAVVYSQKDLDEANRRFGVEVNTERWDGVVAALQHVWEEVEE